MLKTTKISKCINIKVFSKRKKNAWVFSFIILYSNIINKFLKKFLFRKYNSSYIINAPRNIVNICVPRPNKRCFYRHWDI